LVNKSDIQVELIVAHNEKVFFSRGAMTAFSSLALCYPVYPHLFQPLKVGNITIRNRIMQSAHAMAFNTRDGITTERDIHYHVARAKGGIGLMVTGNRLVHPTSSTFTRGYPDGYRAEMVERDRSLTDAVHRHGAKIFVQLNHFGVMGETHAIDDYRQLWSASNIKSPIFGEMSKSMERSDMDEVRDG
jgi:2,4-dienoyl-CoA reductase-like NADH-dependent reductase (Old Yellow Enzyme family)